MKPPVVLLVGPTASGKTDLAIKLSSHCPIEIVNADSLQIFRYLDIGTSKPTADQRSQVPHHLVDVLDPDEKASAAWYSTQARQIIFDIHQRKKIPLVVGGSGFYLRALEYPPIASSTSLPEDDHNYDRLKSEDPEAAKKIHPNDRYRIGRAVAILKQGGKPSDLWRQSADGEPFFRSIWLALDLDRSFLYEKINQRVALMFEQGLTDETKAVLEQFPNARHRLERTIGYRETLQYLSGDMTYPEAISKAQQTSRNYAKRQLTWFRAEKRIEWFAQANAFDSARTQINKEIL